MLTRAVKSCLLFVALACTCEAFSPSLLPSVLPNPASMRSDVRRRQGSLSLRAQQGNGQLSEAMKKKLAAESDAPLRFPLLWAAAVLAGKGSTDLVFTELKYLTGVSKEPLTVGMGAIDVICMAAGVALALRASDAWKGCLYNPTTWKLGSPWFLAKEQEVVTRDKVVRAQEEGALAQEE